MHTPDEARAVLTREIHNLGSTVDIELRDRITNIHSNANALDKQSQQLRNKTNQLAKTTKQWGSMADNARGKLKVCLSYCCGSVGAGSTVVGTWSIG